LPAVPGNGAGVRSFLARLISALDGGYSTEAVRIRTAVRMRLTKATMTLAVTTEVVTVAEAAGMAGMAVEAIET
jgi:hypothetical protein